MVAVVQCLSDEQVADLAEAIRTHLPQPEVTPGEGEGWLLITARASTFATTAGTGSPTRPAQPH